MNQGFSKKKAFEKTEELFRERREYLEREQKVMMAMALDSGLTPMFTTGAAYLQAEVAEAEEAQLKKILRELRSAKQGRQTLAERRREEKRKLSEADGQRVSLV